MFTLKHSLQEVVRLGPAYVVSEPEGEEWTASDLLRWLQTQPPALLRRRVYLVLPTASEEGAIYTLGQSSTLTLEQPLYRIAAHPLLEAQPADKWREVSSHEPGTPAVAQASTKHHQRAFHSPYS